MSDQHELACLDVGCISTVADTFAKCGDKLGFIGALGLIAGNTADWKNKFYPHFNSGDANGHLQLRFSCADAVVIEYRVSPTQSVLHKIILLGHIRRSPVPSIPLRQYVTTTQVRECKSAVLEYYLSRS